MIKAFWYKSKNVGDTLTPIIVEHFTGQPVQYVERTTRGKLLAVGSIMNALRLNDVVWGAGVLRQTDSFINRKNFTVLAVRGKLSEAKLHKEVGVYGDPALLLPLMYNPPVECQYEVGYIPHYVEKAIAAEHHDFSRPEVLFIDVEDDWKTVVENIKSCKRIVSSSLHGIIIAEAYGIPAEWIYYTDKVIGQGFKFRDYLTGTGRGEQGPGKFPPIKNLPEIQQKLIDSLQNYYSKHESN